jgi:hypothetical protein
MKLFIPLICLSIYFISCSFSSSAYERELEKCEKRRLLDRLYRFSLASDPNLKPEERDTLIQEAILYDILVYQINSCKNRVARQNYVNGPLP